MTTTDERAELLALADEAVRLSKSKNGANLRAFLFAVESALRIQANTRSDAGVREVLDRVVKFDDCETPEPRLRDMVFSYYMMGLNPDHALAKKCAERFIAALTTPAQAAGTTEGE